MTVNQRIEALREVMKREHLYSQVPILIRENMCPIIGRGVSLFQVLMAQPEPLL